jgi:hypothetical protein
MEFMLEDSQPPKAEALSHLSDMDFIEYPEDEEASIMSALADAGITGVRFGQKELYFPPQFRDQVEEVLRNMDPLSN